MEMREGVEMMNLFMACVYLLKLIFSLSLKYSEGILSCMFGCPIYVVSSWIDRPYAKKGP